MFELRCLSVSYGLICVLKGLYNFYVSLMIMNSIAMLTPIATTIIVLIALQNVALVMMGLKLIKMAISSHEDTPHIARSVVKEALPAYLLTQGFTQIMINILPILFFPVIPFRMVLNSEIGMTYIFMGTVLAKFGHEHLGNQLDHAPDQELNNFSNQLGFAP